MALWLASQATGLARSGASSLVRGREGEKISWSTVILVAPTVNGNDATKEGGGAVVGFEEVVMRLRNPRLVRESGWLVAGDSRRRRLGRSKGGSWLSLTAAGLVIVGDGVACAQREEETLGLV